MAATLLVMRPVPANAVDGHIYLWTATGPGSFTDPANWTRTFDGAHAVPGPIDSAAIDAPAGTVTLSSDVTVHDVNVTAPVDGNVDFRIAQGGSLHAVFLFARADSDLGGGVDVALLALAGTTAATGSNGFHLSARNGVAAELQMGNLTVQPSSGLLSVDGDSPLKIRFYGGGSTTAN